MSDAEAEKEAREEAERRWLDQVRADAWDDENACPWNCGLPHEHTEGRGADPYYYREHIAPTNDEAAAEYTRRNVGGMQPVMTVGERVHDAFVSGAEWAAGFRRAPAEPAVTDDERPTIELARFIASWDRGAEATNRIPHWAANLAMHLRELGFRRTVQGEPNDDTQGRAPAEPAVTAKKLRTRLECAEGIAREVLDFHKGEISTHYDSCWKRHAGCLAALILDATALTDIAPAELETGEPTDAQVGRALDEFVSKHDEMGESLTDAMRAALRAAFATRGTDDEQ